MKIRTASAACALGLACSAAFAQSSFAGSAKATFAEGLNPDNGVLAMGIYAPGRSRHFVANVDDFRSFASLGQESGLRNSVTAHSAKFDAPAFAAVSSIGDRVSNRHTEGLHAPLGLLGRDDSSPFVTFANARGFDDGSGDDSSGDVVASINRVTAVPEPSTYLMLVAGVGAIVFSALRRLHR